MAINILGIIPLSALNFIGPRPDFTQYSASTNGSFWNSIKKPGSLTIDTASPVVAQINMTSSALQDDPAASWTGSAVVSEQMLDTALTIDGRTYAAGSQIEDEYELDLLGSDGVTYRLAAISITQRVNPNDPTTGYYTTQVVVGFTFDGAWPPAGVTLTYVQGSAHDRQSIEVSNMKACFTRGVKIATPDGEVAVEGLREGMLVLTKDHGPQPVRWIGSSLISATALSTSPELQPIRIKAGALAPAQPAQDLVVSPQHRILLSSQIAQRMFGTSEVLVAARQLLDLPGIELAQDLAEVEYFHILFDRHEILISNGAETESLFTGPFALQTIGAAARNEIFAIFPELAARDYQPTGARVMPSRKDTKSLVSRLLKREAALA